MTENLRRESDAKTLGELVATVATVVTQVQVLSGRIERLSETMESRYQRKDLAEAEAAHVIARITDLAGQIREEKLAREKSVGDLWERHDDDEKSRRNLWRWVVAAIVVPLLVAGAGVIVAVLYG